MEPDDFSFYEKIQVPPPTFCSECRMIRRMVWRNERTLYRRTCSKCEKIVISVYPAGVLFPVYCRDCYYSDDHDQCAVGQEYDFSKPFFMQFKKLQSRAPRMAGQWSPDNINSEYTNHTASCKNCYLSFASVNNEDCAYANYVSYSKYILDGLGELLTEPQKDWVRAKLKEETVFLLKVRLESPWRRPVRSQSVRACGHCRQRQASCLGQDSRWR